MRRTILALLGCAMLLIPAFLASSASARPATLTGGIWWSSVQYPGGIAAQVQYQNTYSGSTLYTRVVGVNTWVGDGSCFRSLGVYEYDGAGNRRGSVAYYWPSGCLHQITHDATKGTGFSTSDFPNMLNPSPHNLRAGVSADTTSVSGTALYGIGA